MPAYIPALKAAGVKWVSGFPISVMDCTWITAVRTGAATAVAARYLARANASTARLIYHRALEAGVGIELPL